MHAAPASDPVRHPIPLHHVRTQAELQEALDRAAHRLPAALRQPAAAAQHSPGHALPAASEDQADRELRLRRMQQLGIPAVDLSQFPIDPNAIRSLPLDLARKHRVIPLMRTATQLAVAMTDPLDWQAHHTLEFFTGLKVEPVFAPADAVAAALVQYYGSATDNERITQLVARLDEETTAAFSREQPEVTESDNTLVRLVNKMITDAHALRASDIHIESRPNQRTSRVRFRIDGELRPYIEVPANFRSPLVSRIKIMCGLDISEHRRPQDGKIRFADFSPLDIELRVVIMPTLRGLEDVVLRILAPPRALTLDQLGLSPAVLEQVKAIAQRSFGLLFVCGPTGSGKTTTLHSLLGFINTPNRKIWTVEDPIEITQDGLCQVEVNTKLGLTFPHVLRSFLRADPDVIMVGETRDPETAHTVTTASLTGHLVVSTMHTNSAAESVVRLLDFGLDPFNFSDALLGVMGQRLVRSLCACKRSYEPTPDELLELARQYEHASGGDPQARVQRWQARWGGSSGRVTLHAAAGCQACEHTGYKGRLGVYELLLATPEIKAAIQQRLSSGEILRLALASGMVTFEQDAIEKILQGHLDLKQVLASCR